MKSWISKALLGLCIAAPAMAKLPVKTDRYSGLIVRTPGFTTTQNRLIRTGLGLWLQGLQREMPAGSSNFKQVATTYDEDFAGIVSIQLVSGVSPVTCAPWDALDQCAVVITGDDGIQQNVVAKVYTHFVRSGTLATPVSEPIKLQNIAIRTFGRILGVPFSSNAAAMGYSIAWEAKWANELVFPSLAESNAAAAIYGLGARLPDIVPIIEYETKKGDGTKAYMYGNALHFNSMTSNYTLRSARWVANTSANGDVLENVLQGNGRIRQFSSNACYPDEPYGGFVTIYGLTGDADLGLSLPIAKGAPRTEMVRSSGSVGDVISWPHPGTCLTGMGAAVDLLNSL